ncbi:MAG: ribonuclease III [Clostridia bacterium]|nr:ribonuclease III [Clostridia bacterium]
MTEFEKKIGYEFRDKELLKRALTHSSYGNERRIGDNERLEFLGDAVLGHIIGEYLFKKLKNNPEGSLTKIRASLVCEKSLYDISKQIDLAKYILLGHGEEMTGGRERPSIVSDAFEALLAAIYLDSDFEYAKQWVLDLFGDAFSDALSGKRNRDYKTELQEEIQKIRKGRLSYRVVKESGPENNKVFDVEALLDDKVIAKASGKSKKEAEQSAAKNALETL